MVGRFFRLPLCKVRAAHKKANWLKLFVLLRAPTEKYPHFAQVSAEVVRFF
jgi:hypothetical protein